MRVSVWRTSGLPALALMTMLGFCGYSALLPVAPLWAVRGGAGTAGAGLVNGVLLLCTVLTQPLVPLGLRRLGWSPVLVAGMLLLGLAPLVHLVTDDFGVTLAVSAVRGAGFGILTVAGSAAIAELVEPARRGEAIGVYGLAVAVPQLVLLPASPWLAERAGFWVVFGISAIPLVGVSPALALGRHLAAAAGRPSPASPPAERHPAGGQLRALLRPMVLLLGVTLVGGAVLSFLPQMTGSATLTSAGLLTLTLTAALSRWRAGALADRYGTQPFLWPLVTGTALGVGAVAWAVRDVGSTQPIGLLAGMVVLGVCYGALQNLTLVASFDAVPRERYHQASAVWNIGFDAGTGLGSVMVGFVAAASSFPVALLAAAGVSLATVPLAVHRPPRDASTPAAATAVLRRSPRSRTGLRGRRH